MLKKIRTTISGDEYWDSKLKKTIFVPFGQEVPNEESDEETGDSKNEGVEENQEGREDISGFTISELKEYAVGKGIEIPKEITKRDDILEFLS